MAIVIGTGSFLLFFSLAINVVALMVPYWYVDNSLLSGVKHRNHGLWGSCTCKWRYNEAFEKDGGEKEWFKAAQWLYAAGVALMAVAMCTLFILSCCSEKAYAKAMTAAGALMLIAAVLIAVAIVVFGVKSNADMGLEISKGTMLYDWGMWLGVAGFGVALITAIVFLVQGSRI